MNTAAQKMVIARTALVLDQPFFGALALRLQIVEDPTCKTAWVDGVSLGYNPAYIAPLSIGVVKAILAHEVMHCAAGHAWRRGQREPKRWNEACDRAINPIVRDAGFTLPDGVLFELEPGEPMSSEWNYDRIPEPQPQSGQGGKPQPQPGKGPKGGQGDPQGKGTQDPQGEPQDGPQDGQGDQGGDQGEGEPKDDGEPDPLGEVRDAPAETAEASASEGDWQQAVQQAANAAKARGKLGAGLERFAKDAAEARVDWRSVLRRFMQASARADYSWRMPNPRFIGRGLYLPSLKSEQMGTVVVAIDTSGSIDDVLLGQFASEIRSIVDELQPERVVAIYCDARVGRVDTFERGEEFEVHPCGGGGTSHVPVFEAIAEMEEQPVAVVCLTDCLTEYPKVAPEVPVLWASTRAATVPFGEVVLCQ